LRVFKEKSVRGIIKFLLFFYAFCSRYGRCINFFFFFVVVLTTTITEYYCSSWSSFSARVCLRSISLEKKKRIKRIESEH